MDTTTVSGVVYFLSKDPIGERGGYNLYGFVWNSPIIFIDYLGLVEKCTIGGTAHYAIVIGFRLDVSVTFDGDSVKIELELKREKGLGAGLTGGVTAGDKLSGDELHLGLGPVTVNQGENLNNDLSGGAGLDIGVTKSDETDPIVDLELEL